MHAIDIRGNATTRIGIVTAAVGVVVALTLGLILLSISEEQALTLPLAAPSIDGFEQIKFLEDNQPLPVYAGSPARSLAEMQLMEENVEFQAQVNNRSYLDIQWMEDNVEFQAQVTGPALSYLDIKLIEDNAALPISNVSATRTHANMQVEE